MSFHLVPASAPAGPDAALLQSLGGGAGEIVAAHALAADCACSRMVARRLITRGEGARVREAVIWSGRDAELERGLAAAGFEVRRDIAPPAGVPQLLVYGARGEALYAGGYAPRLLADESEARDAAILEAVLVGRVPDAYPIYGCATGRAARRERDPLGLKY